MDVYITAANAKKILAGADSNELKKIYLDDLYKMSLWMFSEGERRWLGAARTFFENPDFYVDKFYKPVAKSKDKSSDFVFVSKLPPAYHIDPKCEKLISDYSNYLIPAEIVHKGEKAKDDFRIWFDENRVYLEEPEVFINKMSARFFLKNPPNIEAIKLGNSGVVDKKDLSLGGIENRISEKISEMDKVRCEHRALIAKFGMKTHLIEKVDETVEDPKELEILKNWHQAKMDLKADLRTYFQLRFNPDLKFSGSLLESLGFRKCTSCAGGVPF